MSTNESTTSPPETSHLLREVLRLHWRKLLLPYSLFLMENVLRLLQPFVLGYAITGLLAGSPFGLLLLAVQFFCQTAASSARGMLDTRVFTGIYTGMVSKLVSEQRQRISLSQVAARSSLSRQVIDFLEREIIIIAGTLISLGGCLVALAWYDLRLPVICVLLLASASLINRHHAKHCALIQAEMNDEYEHEVQILEQGNSTEILQHYQLLARGQVKLSDRNVFSYIGMEVVSLVLLCTSLFWLVRGGNSSAGDIVATVRYLMIFCASLNSLPMLIQQFVKIRDICTRLSLTGECTEPGTGWCMMDQGGRS